MYLKIEKGSKSKSYALTDNYAKPYLKVSNSVLPLTTNTTNGFYLGVKSGDKTYRAMEYVEAQVETVTFETTQSQQYYPYVLSSSNTVTAQYVDTHTMQIRPQIIVAITTRSNVTSNRTTYTIQNFSTYKTYAGNKEPTYVGFFANAYNNTLGMNSSNLFVQIQYYDWDSRSTKAYDARISNLSYISTFLEKMFTMSEHYNYSRQTTSTSVGKTTPSISITQNVSLYLANIPISAPASIASKSSLNFLIRKTTVYSGIASSTSEGGGGWQ